MQRAKLAIKIEPFFKKRVAENKKRCGKKKQNLPKSDKFEPVDCLGLMAEATQVGRQLIDDFKYILNSNAATAEDKRDLEEQKYGASTIRKQIEDRIKKHEEDQEDKNNDPPVEFINPTKGNMKTKL